jgi:mannosyltransferase OCH1-like enzyme
MKIKYLFLCILCILCILSVILVFFLIKNSKTYKHKDKNILKDTYKSSIFNTDVIPKKVIQTYFDISKIPQKVYNNMNIYAKGFEHIIYDDNSALSFLDEFYSKHVVQAFNKLKNGAHKADLLRYCLLYIYGGIYLDIKTELIAPLIDIFYSKSNIDIYVVLMDSKDGIYNGLIATKPQNKIFLELIDHILRITYTKSNIPYLIFVKHFLFVLSSNIKTSITLSKTLNSKFGRVYFFNEICTKNDSDCPDGLDRYGSCCYIYDNNKKIIKVRYSDYPWK